jgi:hypothetical protein
MCCTGQGGVEAYVADDDNVSGTSCRRQDTACIRGCGQVSKQPRCDSGCLATRCEGRRCSEPKKKSCDMRENPQRECVREARKGRNRGSSGAKTERRLALRLRLRRRLARYCGAAYAKPPIPGPAAMCIGILMGVLVLRAGGCTQAGDVHERDIALDAPAFFCGRADVKGSGGGWRGRVGAQRGAAARTRAGRSRGGRGG